MYTTWWANSCTIIVCCEGMHHMLTDAFWILPLLMRKSLFLSLEVPTSFKNSGYWQETNLITTATTIKNSDLQKQEFQQLAKTKEMGTQLCMHFGLCIHPWRSAACTPCIIPFSPICLQYNLHAKKWRPSSKAKVVRGCGRNCSSNYFR